jgi:glycosyltransferase involved in cell wall biosynthesis
MPNVSVICTVLNEEATIEELVRGLAGQTRLPDETILVDGGSTDRTLVKLKKLKKKFPQLHLKVYQHVSNRSVGRNFAISKTNSEWIAITDAGCIPEAVWLEELIKKQLKTKAQVVAGYYVAYPKTAFEEAVIPYVLVMPDKIDPEHFLPATRSMLIAKVLFEKHGYFDEQLEVSEDYEFAKRLERARVHIVFTFKAQVQWMPRTTLSEFFTMVSSMSEWDVRANVIRIKALLVVFRYVLIILFSLIAVWWWTSFAAVLLFGSIGLYLGWAIIKNIRHVQNGWYWLPVLQVSADIAVMWGMLKAKYTSYN